MVKYLNGRWHTWYFLLVRSTTGTRATILPPYHRVGTETTPGWEEALSHLSPTTRGAIVALVSDGHRGLVLGAQRQGWLMQRCHFHLLKRLQAQRSRWRTGRNREEAEVIHTAVTTVLSTTKQRTLADALDTIEHVRTTSTSREVRTILSGFLANYRDFQTYLTHPHLNLPTTSNTAEVLVGLTEELSRRARGFRTVAALNEWITVLVKVRKTISCKGK